MKVVLLGTGGYYPTSERHTACIMLPEIGVVLDAGSGMCRLGDYLATDRLDIFLSHAHLDHILGLTYMITAVPHEVAARTTVHGDPAKLAAIREHLFNETIFPVMPAFQCAPLEGSYELAGGGRLSHFPLGHPGGSLGFRLDWPHRSMAYVTDTTAHADADYIEKIAGVDLLVHECYFATNERNLPEVTGHSWLMPVAEVAAKAKVGRLVLVHIGPHIEDDRALDLASARRICSTMEIGIDRAEFEL